MLAGVSWATIHVDSSTRTFRDSQGRARIFHGQNVVVKAAPYIPSQDAFDPFMSVSTEDLENMRDWGVKLVRLGVLWEAVETAPGVYDHAYLEEVDKLVNRFAEYGIYSMLDNH